MVRVVSAFDETRLTITSGVDLMWELTALLPTISIYNAFLVIIMQFSIGKMINRKNLISVYRIDRLVSIL